MAAEDIEKKISEALKRVNEMIIPYLKHVRDLAFHGMASHLKYNTFTGGTLSNYKASPNIAIPSLSKYTINTIIHVDDAIQNQDISRIQVYTQEYQPLDTMASKKEFLLILKKELECSFDELAEFTGNPEMLSAIKDYSQKLDELFKSWGKSDKGKSGKA